MDRIKHTHLRVFVTVATLGSLSLAAQKLHRSPSAISMTLSQLERELGQPLFEADSKSHLTPFGKYVLQLAGEEVMRFDRALSSMRALACSEAGKLDLASVPSFALHFLPRLLRLFLEARSELVLNVRDDTSDRILEMVERGSVDLGIAGLPLSSEGTLRFTPLLEDPLGVVVAQQHQLAQLDRPLTWEDLEGELFISNGTCRLIRHAPFLALLENAGMSVNNTTSLLAIVSEGVGVTTLPALSIPKNDQGVVFKPTAYPDLTRRIGLIAPTGRTLPPPAQKFESFLEEYFRDEPGVFSGEWELQTAGMRSLAS